MLKNYAMVMAAFVPEAVKRHIFQDNLINEEFKPATQEFRTVALFADVSGFTALSEKLAQKGSIGCEELGFYLNRYLERLGLCIVGG